MKLKLSITLILLFIFILTGNSYAETKDIGNDEIKRLMSLGIPLIDVRRKDEWVSTGVIESSYHHTFFEKDGTYDFKGFINKVKNITNSEKGIILFCRTGRRTAIIAKMMEIKNFDNVIYNAKNGITSWIDEKLITVKPQY